MHLTRPRMKSKRSPARDAAEIREYQILPAEKIFPLRRKMLLRLAASLTKKAKPSPRNPAQP